MSAFVSRQAFWEQPRNDDAAAVRSSQPRLLTVAAYVSGSPIPRLRRVLPHKWGRVVPSPAFGGYFPINGEELSLPRGLRPGLPHKWGRVRSSPLSEIPAASSRSEEH